MNIFFIYFYLKIIINSNILLNSVCISNIFLYVVFKLYKIYLLVKIFVLYAYNPQITNARIKKIYKSEITLNRRLSMLVGISEAICLLFFKFNILYFYTYYNLFKIILIIENKVLYLKHIFIYFYLLLFNLYLRIKFFNKTKFDLNNLNNYSLNINLINNSINNDFFNDNNFDINNIQVNKDRLRFNQWLAGLIDGDGYFSVSKKGYSSLEIVMETRDKHALYQIKQKFGGSVKLLSGVKAVRYRLHHKKGLIDLINAINGEIRNPIRLLQLNKVCQIYNISLSSPKALTFDNGWFSGFFDADGSVYLNLQSSQMFITAGQKNRFLLDPLVELYGGTIYTEKISFKWVIFKKAEIIKLLEYFKLNPPRSAKKNRILSITKYHELRELKAHLSNHNSTILGKAWKKFLLKWDKFEK